MLKQLTITDFVLVSQMDIPFEAGLTVLTGETGAGKSILIDAISFALGEKGDASLIKEGASRAEVSLIIDVTASLVAQGWLMEQAIELEEGECLVRRLMDETGRSRGYINGCPVSMTQLRAFADYVIDISGQHAHQLLLRPDVQRQTLDAQAGLLDLTDQVSLAYGHWKTAEKTFRLAQMESSQREEQIEQTRWEMEDLEPHVMSPEDWQMLQETHQRQAHASTLIESGREAITLLSDAEYSALHQLGHIRRILQQMSRYDEQGMVEPLTLAEDADIAISECVRALQHYLDNIDMDAVVFERLDDQMTNLLAVARKYRIEPEAIPERYQAAVSRLTALEAAADLKALECDLINARKHYDLLAGQLSEKRKEGAEVLSQQVTQALSELGMKGSIFQVELSLLEEPNLHGNERVVFLLQANAGGQPRPIHKVASGGELSRIGLAISTVTSQASHAPILVFDEVDAGIGGRTGNIVGQMLRKLGTNHQVFCITHLPQVAVYANHQLRVDKQTQGDQTKSTIEYLDHAARVHEIARMLGGTVLTEATKRHAEEMLIQARGEI